MRTTPANAGCAVLLLVSTLDCPAQAVGGQSCDFASLRGAPRHTTSSIEQDPKPAEQRVTGEVVDVDGNPVESATVRFVGPKRDSVVTDSDGAFSFSGPPGDYTITVVAGTRTKDFTRKIENNQLKPSNRLAIDREQPRP